MHPPLPPSIPRPRSSQTIASVGIHSSSSFSRLAPVASTSASSSLSEGADDVDSDWELPEVPSSPVKPRKVVGYAVQEKKATGGSKALPKRERQPSTLTKAGGAERKDKAGQNDEGEDKDRVLVCVRMKPPLPESFIYECSTETNTISLGPEHPSNKKRGVIKGREQESEFTVDHLHLPPAPTSELFDRVVSPLVSAAMDGFDGTVFAYGMTGSGKTYTMGGVPDDPGVIPRAIDQIFDIIDQDSSRETTLRVSYMELYNEKFRDLLNPSAAIVPSVYDNPNDGRVCVRNLQENTVRNPEDVQKVLKLGESNRRTGKTDWNEQSSRSHSIFTITIESRPISTASSPALSGPTQFSRLNLIDLAGSEKATADVERLAEGKYINQSLLTLGNVIKALTEAKPPSHISYRSSKLTRLLEDSLSGHARIAVICTVSFDKAHSAEALATLKFARRASRVVTKAKRGTIASDKSIIHAYETELATLRAQLAAALKVPSITPSPNPQDNSDSEEEDEEKLEEERERLAKIQLAREKEEELVFELQLKRTRLESQISAISDYILRSEPTPSSPGSPQAFPPSRRRRLSEVFSNGLGLGTPSSVPGGPQRRHVSVLGVVDEDAAGGVGKGRRGDRMLGVGMAALSEEASDAKEQALEAKLVELRTRLAQLQSSETALTTERDALVATLRWEIETLEKSLQSLAGEREESLAVIEKLRLDLESVSTARTTTDEELERLQAQAASLVKLREQDAMLSTAQSAAVAALHDTVATLRAQMREQDDQVGSLKAQLLTAERARDAAAELAQVTQAKLQVQINSLGSKLAELEEQRATEVASVQKEVGSLQARLFTAEIARDASLKLSSSAQSELRLQDESIGLQLAALENRRKAEVKSTRGELEPLQAQLLAAEAARDASSELAKTAQSDLQLQIEALRSQLTEVEGRRKGDVASLQEELERTKTERDTLLATTEPSDVVRVRISSLEDQLAQTVAEHEVEAQVLRSQVEEAVSTLASSSSADRVWIEELTRQLREQQNRGATAEAEIEMLRVEHEETEQQRIVDAEDAIKERKALRQHLAEAQQQRVVEAQEASKEVNCLRAQLTQINQERLVGAQSSSQEMDDLRAQLAEAQHARTTQESASAVKMESLRQELDQSRQSNVAAESRASDTQRRLEDSAQQLASAVREQDELAVKAAYQESELSTNTRRLESLNQKLLDRAPPPSPRKGIVASPSIAEGLNLHRTGSLHESRRHQPTSNLPYTQSSRINALSPEQEEIGRLNQIIVHQRELLAQWAMTSNHHGQIIKQLIDGTLPSSYTYSDFQAGQLPSTYSTSSTFSFESSSPSTPRGSPPPSLPIIASIPPPPTIAASELPKSRPLAALDASNLENRGLPTTPAGTHLSSYVPSSPKPPPLPHAGHQRSNSQARSARRITIENDMEKLKTSSRMEQSKSIFNSPARPSPSNKTPTRKL